MGSIKSDPRFQWAYCGRPLYCCMDIKTLDETGWSFWDDLDGCLDAPECYPVGSLFGRDKYYLGFVPRGYDVKEHAEKVALAKRLIDEIIAEEQANTTQPPGCQATSSNALNTTNP